jgi:O-antigen/teichoic acid export membrane protein
LTEEVSELHWRLWREELKARTFTPARHPSFVLYFIVAVVIIGGAGVWLELHKFLYLAHPPAQPSSSSLDALRTALLTFSLALAGSSCMQIVLADQNKSMRATAVCLLTGLVAVALWVFPANISDGSAVSVGVIGSLLALWTWWIANALQPDFRDNDIDAPVGRTDPTTDLPGSLDGFEA